MNESTQNNASAESMSAFLPLLILGISFAIILFFQVSSLTSQKTFLNRVIEQGKQGVQQSQQVQAGLQNLVMDLITAAKDDKDAQAIITKYGIQVGGVPAGAAPSTSPAASK